ncbi:MAG TPA: PLP-dependent aminotransferase family protein [Terriglobales bacterium]|nr:PLP-dependent aminotransferase family protein [Terriglobales bacterium]
MAKRTTSLGLMLPQRNSQTPAYRWLYESLRGEILEGRLRPGARLPASRELARQYGLSRGTIVNAFEQLRSEGYAAGTIGSGTHVSKVLPDDLLQVDREESRQSAEPKRRKRELSQYARRVTPFPVFEVRPVRAFRANHPALELFPVDLWAQITARRLRRISTGMLLGCSAMGYRPLRDAVADYLNTSRGVKCVAEQVAIVSGVQEALDAVARVLLDPGDRVAMENPGYIGATIVFRSLGAKISPLPVDEEGMELGEAKLSRAKLVYVTPGHQFPLGITMSLGRRLELLAWARRSGATIFEDDYDSEYRYRGRPVPALQGLDRHGLVLYAGSFSKVLFPSLRLGYLVLPADLVEYFAATKSVTARHAPLLEQAVLCDFISEGHFARHIRRMREIYAERLAVLLEAARESLDGLMEVSNIEAGLQTVGWLQGGVSAERVARAAAERGLEMVPLQAYALGRLKRQGVQLGFAAVDPVEIRRGIGELHALLDGMGK